MSPLLPRSTWVDPRYPVTGSPARLDRIDRIVVHYPGVPDGALNLADPVGVLRATHRYYLAKKPNGYSIGYSFATFPSGRYECRGFTFQNAANLADDDGVPDNDHTLSINVMVNGDDEATPSQVGHTRDMIADIWTVLNREVPLVAHGDLPGASTACPGAGIRRQLEDGVFLPQQQPPSEVDMATTMHLTCFTNPEAGEALWIDGKFMPFVSPEDRDTIVTALGSPVRVALTLAQFQTLQRIGI